MMLIINAVNFFISIHLILAQIAKDDVIEMIEETGFPAELHTVITEDDYVLGIHRIPMREPTSKIALLMHGIHSTSADFIVTGRSNSLAYLLADHGYDVWLANARGNEFSKNHRTLNASSVEYWNFSFHEMAQYDLPATIDYILDMTNQTALHYIGHSQGTTVVIAMLSMLPMYNEKLLTIHLMCPVVFLKYTGMFFRTISQFSDQIQGAVDSMDTGEMFPGTPEFRKLLSYFCSKSSASYQMCKDYMSAVAGPTFQWNDDLFIEPKIFRHFPNSISYKQLMHYGQIIKAGGVRFLQYDYKIAKNLQLYNQTTPPPYNLSNVNARIHFLYGTNDFMSSYLVKRVNLFNAFLTLRNFIVGNINITKDIEALMRKLRTSTVGIDKLFGWNHADFLIGREANTVNKKILKLMKQYNGVPLEY